MSQTTASFFTVGYEQSDSPEFLRRLRSHRVDLVVDVRQLPLSRKKGFSKTPLRDLLAAEGIDYLHMKTLGAPKELRERRRQGCSWAEYVEEYEKVLAGRAGDIATLNQLACKRRICLLCFERKPEECHRSLVAQEMEKRGKRDHIRAKHIRY